MLDNERLAKLENQLEENGRTTWHIFEAVYGNGKPGLVADVQALRQAVESLRRETTLRNDNWQWIITTIVAVIAIAAAWLK